MLEYAGTLLIVDHFQHGFSCGFSFISHIYLESFCHSYIVYYRKISCGCDNISSSLLPLFQNILYVGLLMLKQCICKLCLAIENVKPFMGYFDLVLQLHGFVFGALYFINFLLCELIMLEMFSVQ